MSDTREYMCENCGGGFKRDEMILYEKDRAYLVQAEDGDEFQEYVDEDGKRVPQGEDVGVEIVIDSEVKFFLLEGIYFP